MISTLSALIFLLSPVLIIISLIKPSFFNTKFKQEFSRKQWAGIFTALTFSSAILTGMTASPSKPNTTEAKQEDVVTDSDKEEKQKLSPTVTVEPTATHTPAPTNTPTPTLLPTKAATPTSMPVVPTNMPISPANTPVPVQQSVVPASL